MKTCNVVNILVFAMLCVGVGVGSAKHDGISFFVFGDSLEEVGNNNYIQTLSRANYPPNGIDFGEPTGRFTNGKIITDIIVQEIGLEKFIPPYLAPTTTGDVVLAGVNYASGSGGILNSSGYNYGDRISLDEQLDNFANTREYIISRIGIEEAQQLFRKAIFSVAMGSNDFINNYLLPNSNKLLSPEAFVGIMISTYRQQLTRLCQLGAAKIVVVNVGPLGCIPHQRDLNPSAGDDCVSFPNQLARLFNTQLRTLVSELAEDFNDLNFVYADVYHIFQDVVQNYTSYGFTNMNSSCCHIAGNHGGLVPCIPPSSICPDRSKFVFWDCYHPTEAMNMIIANRLFNGDSNDISPMNIRQLLDL